MMAFDCLGLVVRAKIGGERERQREGENVAESRFGSIKSSSLDCSSLRGCGRLTASGRFGRFSLREARLDDSAQVEA